MNICEIKRKNMIDYLSNKYSRKIFEKIFDNAASKGFEENECFNVLRFVLGNEYDQNELFTHEEISMITGLSYLQIEKAIKTYVKN